MRTLPYFKHFVVEPGETSKAICSQTGSLDPFGLKRLVICQNLKLGTEELTQKGLTKS